jgi:hypothetical protein
LRSSTGLNTDVFDALVLLAAGRFTATAIESGWAHVQELQDAMHEGRSRRLVRLGFAADEAGELSSLHTRNFM